MTRTVSPPAAIAARLVLPFLALVLAVPPAAAGEAADLAAVRRLLEEAEPSARAAAVRRLAGTTSRAGIEILLERLDDPHPYVRRAAAGVLGTLDEEVRPRLVRHLARLRRPTARVEACRVFTLWADDRGRLGLLAALKDREAEVRRAALAHLTSDLDEAVTAVLPRLLNDPDGGVRALALDAQRERPGAALPSVALLNDPDPRVRFSALEISVAGAPPGTGGGAAVVAVLHGLDDAVWSVRLLAAELSRCLLDRRLLPALVRTLTDERRRVATAAHASLVALTGIPFDDDPAPWHTWLQGDGADFDPATREPGPERPLSRGGGHTVALPRFMGLALVSRHVGFVLDASGSMARRLPGGESRWERACLELEAALDGLGPGCVNVFAFHSEVEVAFPRAVELKRGRRAALTRWLAERKPAGRTALYDGVAAALADPDLDTIVVLSDGAPSAGLYFTKTDLLGEIERLNRWRRARIDVISIGGDGVASRWRDVLRRMAKASGGTCIVR